MNSILDPFQSSSHSVGNGASELPPGPIHPGDFLAESVLPTLDVSIAQAARDLAISRQGLHRIIARTAPVTAGLAIRLEEYTGCAAELWLLLQMSYDLSEARAQSTDAP